MDDIFDLLVQHVAEHEEFNLSFIFDADIDKWYMWADVVVCHVGAGTVFNVLEQGIKVLVIPNMSRSESHQQELVNFLLINNLSRVLLSMSNFKSDIKLTFHSKFNEYNPDEFVGAKDIVDLLL